MAAYQYVYVMKDLSKAYPAAGKSSRTCGCPSFRAPRSACSASMARASRPLLKIMAGIDKEFTRRGLGRRGRQGRLSGAGAAARREARRAAATSWTASPRPRRCSTASRRCAAKFAEELSDDEMNELIAEQAELQEKIDASTPGTSTRQIEIAMDALRCPPRRCRGRQAVGRRAAPRGAVPAAAVQARLLLLDEPTNHLDAEIGGLAANAILRRLSRAPW